MKEIIKALESKGYMVFNQFDGFYGTEENRYELWNMQGELVEDNMTIEDLKKML